MAQHFPCYSAVIPLDALPEDMIGFRRLHLHQALSGEYYDELF